MGETAETDVVDGSGGLEGVLQLLLGIVGWRLGCCGFERVCHVTESCGKGLEESLGRNIGAG